MNICSQAHLKTTVLFGLCLLSSGAQGADKKPPEVNGFGPGDNGANRRVRTIGGYGGVAGVYSEPSAMASDDVLLAAWHHENYDPKHPDNHPYDASKPQPYMGGGRINAPVQIDYGLTYEAFSSGPVPPGWDLQLYINSPLRKKYYGAPDFPLQGPDGSPWRIRRGALGDCITSFVVNPDGSITLEVSPLNNSDYSHSVTVPNVFPVESNGKISQATVNDMFVKRVTAMTQPTAIKDSPWTLGTATLDDSFFIASRWSQGVVGHWVSNANGSLTLKWPPLPSLGLTWDESTVDLSAKGSGIDIPLKDGRGNWIIDFEGPDKRDSKGNTPHDPTRYTDETIDISLFRPGHAGKGTAVKSAQYGF